MLNFHLLCIVFVSLYSFSDAKTFKLKVRTGDSGTLDYVKITIYGTKGSVERTFLALFCCFSRHSTDDLEITGGDIGTITNIGAKLIKHGFLFDHWQLQWIKVSVDGNEYQGYFDNHFDKNGMYKKAKRFEINKCRKGSEVHSGLGRTTCRDTNECLTQCNSPSQSCTNNVGSYSCACAPGYIGQEGENCRDFNECANSGQNPCNFKNAHCVNLPGTYECRCNVGYQGDYTSCIDKNECVSSNHDCSQECENTPGSYQCKCLSGYKLAIDGKTCMDVDECSSPNPCNSTSSVCYDEIGGYRCICRNGYEANAAKPNECIALECPAITSGLDKNSILSPERCVSGKTRFGDDCHVSCKDGYYLDPRSAKSLKCQKGYMNGFVNIGGNLPVCKPRPCPKITPPQFADMVPMLCSSIGGVHGKACSIYCQSGYVLVGHRKYNCFLDKYDKDPSKAFCTRVPRISCPSDVSTNLPADSDKVTLGNAYPDYTTNMRVREVTSNIPGVGSSYKFSMGTTVVAYTATNALNQTDSCSFTVTVKDKSIPTIEYCPPHQYLVSKGGVSMNVTWAEPRFKDNVGIDRVKQNVTSGQLHAPTSFSVQYLAQDKSGNAATCSFTTQFKVLTCGFNSTSGGDQFTTKFCFSISGSQKMCMANCANGKTFDIINSKAVVKNMFACTKADFGIDRMPDCVDFTAKNGAKCPKGSIITKDYRKIIGPDVCGKCPRGTYFIDAQCLDCPKGTYQDQEGSMSCKECPARKGTTKTRTILSSSCEVLCLPGYKTTASNWSTKCSMCPGNTYSEIYGSTSCKNCPNGTATEGPGKTGIHRCVFAPRNVTMVPAGKVIVTEGENVFFDCFGQGNPLPSILISKATGDASSDTHGHLPSGELPPGFKGQRYMISPVTKYDAGMYVCRAENRRGDVYKKIELVVTQDIGSGSFF